MPCLGTAEFGAFSFCASCHAGDQCGANGLPLTPHSICVLGLFQRLLRIEHPRLCKYLDLCREKHERMIVVAEYYQQNLAAKVKDGHIFRREELLQLAYDILSGLVHMNSEGLVHRNLSARNVLFDSQGRAKLAFYGLYYMTGHGTHVSFPIGVPKYMAPEVICSGSRPYQVSSSSSTTAAVNHDSPKTASSSRSTINIGQSSSKVDVWSLGIILIEAILGHFLFDELTLSEMLHRIIRFVSTDRHPFDILAEEYDHNGKLRNLPPDFQEFIKSCLTVLPSKRPRPADLIKLSLFTELGSQMDRSYSQSLQMFSAQLRCADFELSSADVDVTLADDLLAERPVDEVYYLWKLAGGDLAGTLKKAGHIRRRPPITKLSRLVVDDGELFGEERDMSILLDDSIVILPQDQLRQRLKGIEATAYYPLLEDEITITSNMNLPSSASTSDLLDCVRLPLVIREKDVEYQFHRLVLFHRLLAGYPYKRVQILKEARVDIPPFFRAQLWAAILDVEGDVQGRYDSIDKETPIPTDRQIEVDIPRCHQYSELLSSPTGHLKFKRLLKAWVVSHPEYVYWQGLDSMCAPFLYLNFNAEAVAFACLTAFIPKYLHNFFLKDNACIIQEYLAVFSHLIAFHDPQLSCHLDDIGFIPDLYSIPWFLTMYAHVFPLHKIFHLWDTLLLGNSSFPLCIGVAILQQLREQLLSYGFNECILLFSDMPEIDIERCVQDSIKIFCSTPKSATYRQYALPSPVGMGGRPRQSSPLRLVQSYYSQDYHELPKSELLCQLMKHVSLGIQLQKFRMTLSELATYSMEPMTLEELKSEKFPRISAEDLIELSELHGPSPGLSPAKRSKTTKPSIFIIDIRSNEEFKRGSVPGSINIPYMTAFSGGADIGGGRGELSASTAHCVSQHRGQIKVVIGSSRTKQANQVRT